MLAINSKENHRTDIKIWRKLLSSTEIKSRSKKINQNLQKVLKSYIKPSSKVAAYKAFNNEAEIIESKGYSYCYPVVSGASMSFHSEKTKVEKSEIKAFVVPGLAFDHYGNRLGYGGGFYDRFLQNTKALKMGACYSEQVSELKLKTEVHDIKMDIIITENYILEFMSERSQWIKAH